MEDAESVKILAHMIFGKEFLNSEEMILRTPSIPTCLLEKDFYEKMQSVLFSKSRVTACRWRTFFDTSYRIMLSSHEKYITFVMFACINECKCHQNIFERFISVCSLIKLLCDETLQKTGVDFCHLNPDIFMEFYESRLQKLFRKHGGFLRLVEYIRGHRYLTWELNTDNSTQINLDKTLEQELRREGVIEKETDQDEVSRDVSCRILAWQVLSITKVELPQLPSDLDLIKSLMEYRKKEMAKYTEGNRRNVAAEKLEAMDVDYNGCSGSNSNSKTDCIVKHQDNIDRHENIIQAVIRHNHSKCSSNKSKSSLIQLEAGVLEPLKETIKSLIEVLDQYDKQ